MSYHTLKYGTKFLKGTHGFWFTIGALGVGLLIGKKMGPKNRRMKVLPILGARTRKCIKDFQKGWYGIVDEAKGNLNKGGVSQATKAHHASNEVKVDRREISGYQTETISRA